MRKTCFAIVLLAVMVGGCQDFKQKHPDFPKWGWWEKKAPTTQPVTAPSNDASQPLGPVDNPQDSTAPSDTAADMPATQPVDQPAVKGTPIPEPPNHRSEVWEHVSKLRDLNSYPEDEQKKMIAYAQEHVQDWYKSMDVTSPDMNKPDWVIVMVWDFMPPADFQRAAANWKKIAENENVEFPENLTRRKLMKFVIEMQDRDK